MAISKTSIASKVRSRLYGAGLGEKPSIVQATGTAVVSGGTAVFSVASGKGATLRDGHVLSAYNPAADAAYGFLVISLATDAVTAVNGYEGDTIANAATMPTLLEVNSPIAAWEIHDAIDEIIDGYLFPEVFDIVVDSFTPSLTDGQVNADVLDERILRAWQKLGTEWYQIPIGLVKNVDTADFAAGQYIAHDAINSSTVKYSAVRRVSLANSNSAALEALIAKGAAALVAEGAFAGQLWESARADAQERSDQPVSRIFWQSFARAKQQISEDLSRDTVLEFRVERG